MHLINGIETCSQKWSRSSLVQFHFTNEETWTYKGKVTHRRYSGWGLDATSIPDFGKPVTCTDPCIGVCMRIHTYTLIKGPKPLPEDLSMTNSISASLLRLLFLSLWGHCHFVSNCTRLPNFQSGSWTPTCVCWVISFQEDFPSFVTVFISTPTHEWGNRLSELKCKAVLSYTPSKNQVFV